MGRVAEENHAQHRHKVLAVGEVGVGAEFVSGLPEVGFELLDVFEGVASHAVGGFLCIVSMAERPRQVGGLTACAPAAGPTEATAYPSSLRRGGRGSLASTAASAGYASGSSPRISPAISAAIS